MVYKTLSNGNMTDASSVEKFLTTILKKDFPEIYMLDVHGPLGGDDMDDRFMKKLGIHIWFDKKRIADLSEQERDELIYNINQTIHKFSPFITADYFVQFN